MPIYEYRCDACGNRYEKRESFSAPSRQKCTNCGKVATRVLHPPPIVFKGTGFYKTDSRGASADGDSGAKSAAPAEAAPSPSSSSEPTKADIKPETTAAT